MTTVSFGDIQRFVKANPVGFSESTYETFVILQYWTACTDTSETLMTGPRARMPRQLIFGKIWRMDLSSDT
ncbi:unnamed protein product [Fusarium graminearum]|uniref:Uncharacterized protein n=1 Tax=Gibberella zeae TaxID=5518 RepID=A0A9N8NIT5_GIBZA|nr:unnamed protein product [Fusarium graminearum]